MKTILLAVDIYENGPKLWNQEWESKDSILGIKDALISLGYTVDILEKQSEILKYILDFIENHNPENLTVFNLVEGFRSRNREAYIPSLCEYLGVSYTGSDSYSQILTLDKNISKTIIRELGIYTPNSSLLTKGNIQIHNLFFPLFLKPNAEGSSLGINANNIVEDREGFNLVLTDLFKNFDEVLVEEFVDGEDLTIGLLGYEGKYFITEGARISYEDEVYSENIKSKEGRPERLHFDVSDQINKQLKEIVLKIAYRMKILGPARFDFRLQAEKLFFLEINLTPGLSSIYSTLPILCEKSGLTYSQMMTFILESSDWNYKNNLSFSYGKRGISYA
ncbi:MAG: D-alanine--D-alanine ligase [Leptospira sp.]|nr:D-alanine--D-alanine ligase [Leptospira sp.]